MKTLITSTLAILLAGSLALAFVLMKRQTNVATKAKAELQAELEAKTKALDDAKLQQERSAKERKEIAKLADEMGARLAAQQTSSVSTATTGSQGSVSPAAAVGTNEPAGLGKMLAKMMEDPETKKFIRQQQRMVMDQLYSPLVTKLKLTDAEATQFKDFMADHMMKAAEKSTSILGASSQNRAEVLKGVAEDQKQSEEELKVFLGEERYSAYQDYQTTVGERAQLNAFRQQTSATPGAITDDQAEQLLSLIKEEKATMPDLMGKGSEEAKLQALGSEEQVNKLIKAQEELNRRVKAKAAQILQPSQLDSFDKFQTQQIQTLRLGMTMARKMFSE